MKHDLFAIAFAPFGRNDSANGDFLHVSTGRTHTSQCHHFICCSQPQVDGLLVVSVHVLIDTVLLNHEHLATHSQEFVEFVNGKLLKRFPM